MALPVESIVRIRHFFAIGFQYIECRSIMGDQNAFLAGILARRALDTEYEQLIYLPDVTPSRCWPEI